MHLVCSFTAMLKITLIKQSHELKIQIRFWFGLEIDLEDMSQKIILDIEFIDDLRQLNFSFIGRISHVFSTLSKPCWS